MKKISLFTSLLLLLPLYCVGEVSHRSSIERSGDLIHGIPLLGEDIRAAQRPEQDKFHTHDSGVYYENVTHTIFNKINYKLKEGSLRANLEELAGKFGYGVKWGLDTDYDIPKSFTISNRTMPEIFAEAIVHLPVRVVFYTKNSYVTVSPMYDKRETDVGTKYSINPRNIKGINDNG